MSSAIIVQDLGFGDSGKGATVDFLCRNHDVNLVVRHCGGAQSGHNVETADGRRHTFSQFGSGTFADVPTYLGPNVIIAPLEMEREAAHLKELGYDPYETLVVDPDCLVTTFFMQALNRIRELARGGQRHGSCGLGIGATRAYWLKYGQDSLFAKDLHDYVTIYRKVELQRQRVLQLMEDHPADYAVSEDLLLPLLSTTATEIASKIHAAANLIDVDVWLSAYGLTVFEGAQGLLIDEHIGFTPYTTWSDVTPRYALEHCLRRGVKEVCVLGVTRSYSTRHGEGPFPTYDKDMSAMLVDQGNPTNPWQGDLRCGRFDLPLYWYATDAIGGVDSLAVNCVDQTGSVTKACTGYRVYDCHERSFPLLLQWKHRTLRERKQLCVQLNNPQHMTLLYEDFDVTQWMPGRPVSIVGRGPCAKDREYQQALTFVPLEKRLGWKRGDDRPASESGRV